jgi:hypothetical protein
MQARYYSQNTCGCAAASLEKLENIASVVTESSARSIGEEKTKSNSRTYQKIDAASASHRRRIAREMSQPAGHRSDARRTFRNRVETLVSRRAPRGVICGLTADHLCSDCFSERSVLPMRRTSEEAATPKYSLTRHDTFWKTLQRFTLENHRKSLAVPQFVAALSRHPAHALVSNFARICGNPQQEIYVELCRTCGG